jgi:hypothetical protein
LHSLESAKVSKTAKHKYFCNYFIYSFNNMQLTPWSWDLLEKPPAVQLLKNFPTFYGIRRFITVFTRASIGTYPGPDQFCPYDAIPSLQDPSHYYPATYALVFLVVSFLFPHKYPTCIHLLPIHATFLAHYNLPDLIILIILNKL